MDNIKIIKIENFKLNVFKSLLEQSLIVNEQIMLEIGPEMIKSCSFSNTKTFMKLWALPLKELIQQKNEINDLDEPEIKYDFPVFNFYILKGNLFLKYLSVHNTDTVNLEFHLKQQKNYYNASVVIIIGNSDNSSPLQTNFTLTTEEFISNSMSDYAQILAMCTPSQNSFEFILSSEQTSEVKQLVKKLHKSSANNTPFLNFEINKDLNNVTISDNVFKIQYPLITSDLNKIKNNITNFSIMKSDFIMTGNHGFNIILDENESKIILGSKYRNAIIWCLSSKSDSTTINDVNSQSILDSTIDSLSIEEYF
jgi:hypothetical protein